MALTRRHVAVRKMKELMNLINSPEKEPEEMMVEKVKDVIDVLSGMTENYYDNSPYELLDEGNYGSDEVEALDTGSFTDS